MEQTGAWVKAPRLNALWAPVIRISVVIGSFTFVSDLLYVPWRIHSDALIQLNFIALVWGILVVLYASWLDSNAHVWKVWLTFAVGVALIAYPLAAPGYGG